MKLAIMQPYFIPYIGYWQLMNCVDKYVIYDDVNFIKGGWINRNRILSNGKPQYFNIPMTGASSFKKINEVGVNNNPQLIAKNMRVLENAYKKAPYYEKVMPFMEKILQCGKEDLASYIEYSFEVLCGYLHIETELVISSQLEKDCDLKGQEKVLSICDLLQADEYINTFSGNDLYSFKDFKEQGIELKFIKSNPVVYPQFKNEFCGDLSILDVMMFNSQEEITGLLNDYTLITEDTACTDAEEAVVS